MEENEAMEGKDLALDERQEFEGKILEAIKELKKGETTISVEGIEITNYGEQYTINLKGITFGLIDKEGNFSYNKQNFAEIKKSLEEEGLTLEELGLPDIEQWIDEEQQEQEQEELEEETSEEELGEEEKDEEDLSEEKAAEEETIDEEKMQLSKRYGVNPNQIVHISLAERSKRVTGKETMAGLTKWGEKYDDVFILPGEDEYSWKTIGVDKDGKEEEFSDKQVEGKNPNVTIKIQDENSPNEALKEVRPLAMYDIDGKSSYAIVRDSSGKTQALYCRQEEGKGKEYWGQVIPEAQGKNVKEAPAETRESMSREYNSNYDLAKRGESFEKAKSLEERGFPSKNGKGVQLEEIEGTHEENRALSKEAIINDLADRAIAKSPMPINKKAYIELHGEELNARAEKILSIGEQDSEITYEEAIEREAEQARSDKEEKEGKEEEQKLPGQKRGM